MPPLRHDDRGTVKRDPTYRPGFPVAPSTGVLLIKGLCCLLSVPYNRGHDLNVTVVCAGAGLRRYVTNLTDSRTLRRHNLGSVVGRCLVVPVLWSVSLSIIPTSPIAADCLSQSEVLRATGADRGFQTWATTYSNPRVRSVIQYDNGILTCSHCRSRRFNPSLPYPDWLIKGAKGTKRPAEGFPFSQLMPFFRDRLTTQSLLRPRSALTKLTLLRLRVRLHMGNSCVRNRFSASVILGGIHAHTKQPC